MQAYILADVRSLVLLPSWILEEEEGWEEQTGRGLGMGEKNEGPTEMAARSTIERP